MSDGISALEGFDYQAMVALELMLDHFKVHGIATRARPEGVDDVDLERTDTDGSTHRILVQIKKPRQKSDGSRHPAPWSLSDVLGELLTPRWTELQDERTEVWWVLGDAIGLDAAALLDSSNQTRVWAARRSASEWLFRATQPPPILASLERKVLWESPFRDGAEPAGTVEEAERRWQNSLARRAGRAGVDETSVKNWAVQIDAIHASLDKALSRVVVRARYAEAAELRDRLTDLLSTRFGLNKLDVRDVVFRNLRGFVDDIARSRGTHIDLPSLEHEILRVWPRRLPTVFPPPLPQPHASRTQWVLSLASATGAVVGPSGAGKTTSATELFHYLRQGEPDTAVLYAEVRSDTSWRTVLEGVALSVGRRGDKAPFALLPSIREGDEEALLRVADALEESEIRTALLVDLIDGHAAGTLIRDLSRFSQRLPASPRTRLWVFGQEDALAELSGAEREARHLKLVAVPGLDFKEFLVLSDRHGLTDRSALHNVFEALTSGRKAGLQPRIADAVLRLGSTDSALAAARTDDVLLTADAVRYQRLPQVHQEALCALACFAHPFRVEEAETSFPEFAIKAGISAGLRIGLLYALGDGRTEFHETVRRNILAQTSVATRTAHHTRLADRSAALGDRVLEAHHAELASLGQRAREAGRAAFFDKNTADRVTTRAVARQWISPAETFAVLRDDPSPPLGWWRVLENGMDEATTRSLVTWWREIVLNQESHNALWLAPRALGAGRPELLSELLDIVASAPGDNGHYYAASALGKALRSQQFDERLLLTRFERATVSERDSLADVLHSIGSPFSLARWLVHVVASGRLSGLSVSHNHLSDAHVEAIIDAMPDQQVASLIVLKDWGFGAATPYLWKHREVLATGAVRLLQNPAAASRRVQVGLRLLGVCSHVGMLEAARLWASHPGDAQATALAAPLLLDEIKWRHDLSGMALDESLTTETRVAAFQMFVQSGDGGEILLAKVIEISPELRRRFRWSAALSFIIRPSLFALDLLLEDFPHSNDRQSGLLVGTALARCAWFADGPDAEAVAERLVPLLSSEATELRVPVLHALSMLRAHVACDACARLAVAQAGTKVGALAATAACASRPTGLADVQAALDANPNAFWLISVLAARLGDSRFTPSLVAQAVHENQPWFTRRRALLALERLPHAPEVDGLIDGILVEAPLLSTLDSFDGQVSRTLVSHFEADVASLTKLWNLGEQRFVDILTEPVKKQAFAFQATPAQIETCLSTVWRAVQRIVVQGLPSHVASAAVLNDIQRSQVQAAALRLARVLRRVDLLEKTMATSDSPWLVFRAIVERSQVEPRALVDIDRWAALVSTAPCGKDESLQIAMRNAVKDLGESSAQKRPARAVDQTSTQTVLTAEVLIALIDANQKLPPKARPADMSDDALAAIIARLDPKNDSIIEVDEQESDAHLVSLTVDGSTRRRPRTRSTGRAGDRPAMRARLFARFPDQVPSSWLDSIRRGQSFTSNLIEALCDDGDPKRALHVLRLLSDDATEFARRRSNIYRLGKIADDSLVEWFSGVAGAGGATEVAALASFARHASSSAAVPLLRRLMHRIEGHLAHGEIGHSAEDPWLQALLDMLKAERLRDLPGAAEWLVAMLARTAFRHTRQAIVQAAAAFPSMWRTVENEALRAADYEHLGRPLFLEADTIAHVLFQAPDGNPGPST